MFGIGENKPAREFTRDDRNGQGRAFKTKYSRRMRIWRLQAYLVNAQFTVEAANARICEVYNTSIPTIIIGHIVNEQKNPMGNYVFVGSQRFNPRFIVNPN
jgi:hypothetical protein